MSVGGASPYRCRGPSTSVAGTNIDDVDWNVAVTDIDTEQRHCVFTDVIAILDFQLIRLHLGVKAMEGVLIRPPSWRSRPWTLRTADLVLQQCSSTLHAGSA